MAADIDAGEGFELMTTGTIQEDWSWWYPLTQRWGEVPHISLGKDAANYPQMTFRRPILATTSKLAGYMLGAPTEAGHGFVRPGKLAEVGDEYWSVMLPTWLPVIGRDALSVISVFELPIRRKLGTGMASVSVDTKWSCRHKRVTGEKFCVVCSAMYGRRVED